jgi:hypothetical protein
MYPWIQSKVVADPLGSTEHILGTTGLEEVLIYPYDRRLPPEIA